jgi:Concanavalin A-like lectin/glucanases superfamily/Secretion system C-terminal sorting domain
LFYSINQKKYYTMKKLLLSVFTLLSIASFAQAPSIGLLAYYNFENNFNSHNGLHNLSSVTTNPTFIVGKYGNGASFDGSQALLNTSLDAVIPTTNFTIAFWEYRTGNNVYSSAFEANASCYFRFKNSVSLETGIATTNTSGAGVYVSSNSVTNITAVYRHVALVFSSNAANGTSIKTYINGNLINTLTISSLAVNFHKFNNIFSIGGGTNAAGAFIYTKYFQGTIDEMYVYNRSLTEADILKIKDNASGAIPTQLAPTIAAVSATPSNISSEINYSINANYDITNTTIKYGLSSTSLTNTVNGPNSSINTLTPLTTNISGLYSSTQYFYQIVASNIAGKDSSAIQSFTTDAATSFSKAGLLAYYNFENNFNSHNNLHNLTSATATSAGFAAGKVRQCATFDGLQTLSNTSLASVFNDNEFTIAFWANRTGSGLYATMYELFGSNYLRVFNGSERQIGMAYHASYFAFTSDTSKIERNAWHHYAFVYKQSGANKFFHNYIDGVFKDSIQVASGPVSLYHFNNVFTVGGGTNAGGALHNSKYFTGLIDEMYIFNRAVSKNDIIAIKDNTSGVLPTTITQFTALKKENTTHLNWTSENEINVSHFNIERSTNGKEFETIGKVNAGKKEYNFIDNRLPTSASGNTIYYRLQVLDIDGKISFSPTKTILLNNVAVSKPLTVYPTIVASQLNLDYKSQKTKTINITIYSLLGKVLQSKTQIANIGNNNFKINCSQFVAGNYLISINDFEEPITTQQFIKQ